MSIRTKMTMLFFSIIAILLLAFCTTIYFLSEIHRKKEYQVRLRQEAQVAATVLFNKEEVSLNLLKLLARNQMTVLNKEEIAILNNKNQIIYQSGKAAHTLEKSIVSEIKSKKEFFWQQGEVEKYGVVFVNKNQPYIVIISAVDIYGLNKQQNLALLLSIGAILVLFLSAIAGWFFAGLLLKPMRKMIKKIDNINASDLNLRLNHSNNNDELAQLSLRFNEMLDRLQKAFNAQRSFVSHASHELRTPLTAITGQIQVSLLANDNVDELRLMAKSVLEDVSQLNRLTNNILDLTSIGAVDKSIKVTLINIVELLWQVRSDILNKHPYYKILIALEEIEEYLPEIHVNESLMYTVLLNLVENGSKFSADHTIHIKLILSEKQVIITFKNKSENLQNLELPRIFEPFMRGSNAKNIKGHGVGLSLTRQIVLLHKGILNVNLVENNSAIVFELKLFKHIL